METRSYDGIIGLALADAMGVPVEFQSREVLRQSPVTTVEGYGTYNMPEGCWSDDTSLTIATMDAIIKNSGSITKKTYNDIGNNFASYAFSGSFTPTDKMFDIGNTTWDAIMKFCTGTPATKAGGNGPYNAGNGALMRILPIAYYAHHNNLSDMETLKTVAKISSITHRLPTCILGSYIYTQFSKALLSGKSKEEAYHIMQASDYSIFSEDLLMEYYRVLCDDISRFSEDEISSKGKTRPTLEAALWSFMNADNYDSAILKAINLGDDTDTVGACTGGLAGLYYGAGSINPQWLSKLKKSKYLEDLCSAYDIALIVKTCPASFKRLEIEGKPNIYGKNRFNPNFVDGSR